MTGRARAELIRQRFPLAAGAETIHDASEHDAIRHARAATVRLRPFPREQRGNRTPQLLRNGAKLGVHVRAVRFTPRTTSAESCQVLGFALSSSRRCGEALKEIGRDVANRAPRPLTKRGVCAVPSCTGAPSTAAILVRHPARHRIRAPAPCPAALAPDSARALRRRQLPRSPRMYRVLSAHSSLERLALSRMLSRGCSVVDAYQSCGITAPIIPPSAPNRTAPTGS